MYNFAARMKILLATNNRHKVSEIAAILSDEGLELLSLDDFPGSKPVVEDGRTLTENAVKKAVTPALEHGVWALADDTGLEVAGLAGGPGVHSARYAGPECDFAANCRKLLETLRGRGSSERKAVFRCVVALSSPQGVVRVAEGRLEGEICEAGSGDNGFGYDPVFYIPSAKKTLAELSVSEKNRLSHRARALQAILPVLKGIPA